MKTPSQPDIWINGSFVPWNKACVHPLCHGLQRGSVLFEGIDCNKTMSGRAAIFRLREHMERFFNSSSIIGMPLPYSIQALMDAIVATVARSGMKDCVIRPLAFYSTTGMDVYPGKSEVTVVIGVGDAHYPPESYRVTISSYRKIDISCMPVKAKVSGNYINPMLAKSRAIEAGFDDAILIDRDGFVAEGTTSNIFIVENDTLYTAPEDSILLGITRDTILKISKKVRVKTVLEKFDAERLKNADEVILCSSGKELTPIVQVDDTVIGDGKPGKIALKLGAYYRDIIEGKIPEFEQWLTYV